MRPFYSVLIRVHNAEETLAKALDSVIANDYEEWEIVIVDDGSDDESVHIALKYAFYERRIKVLTLEQQGQVTALNAGLEYCNAPWVLHFDSKAVMAPQHMSAQKMQINSHPQLKELSGGLALLSLRINPEALAEYVNWFNSLEQAKDFPHLLVTGKDQKDCQTFFKFLNSRGFIEERDFTYLL